MKKVMLTLAIAVMGLSTVFAQNPTKRGKADGPKLTAEQRAEKVTNGLEKALSLTADQKTKVYAIELDRAQKIDAMRAENNGDMKDKAKSFKATMDASKDQLDQILTAEQKTKLEDLKAKMKDRKANGRGRMGNQDKAPVVSNPPKQG